MDFVYLKKVQILIIFEDVFMGCCCQAVLYLGNLETTEIVDFSDIESRILSLELEALFRSLSDALN